MNCNTTHYRANSSSVPGDPTAQNPGTALITSGLSLSVLLVSTWVHQSTLSFSRIGAALFGGAVVVSLFSLLEIYFGYTPFGDRLFYGLPVGGRNYLPIYLCLCFGPSLFWVNSRMHKRWGWIQLFLLSLFVVIVVVYRARTAWVGMILQAIAVSVVGLKRRYRDQAIRPLVNRGARAFLGALLILLLEPPTQMKWKSETPYVDSLKSLSSSESSSGRNHLWPFALNIAREHPGLGIGTGQYPVRSREFAKEAFSAGRMTGTALKSLAYLTEDSPAFNDYLQLTVEGGVLEGLVFFLFYLGLPLLWAGRLLTQRGTSPEDLVAIASLCAIGVMAFFTNSFDRPEQLLVVSVLMGYLLRRTGPAQTVSGARWVVRGGLGALVVALSLRYLLVPTTNSWNWHPDLAYRLWPWDRFWNYRSDIRRVDENFILDRARYWPENPGTWLVTARYEHARGRRREAQDFYARAMVEVEFGKCHAKNFETFKSYSKFAGLPTSPYDQDPRFESCFKH